MAVALTTGRQGINRYRIKGGARPDTLFDAVNCYVTVAGSVRPREGTSIDARLPPETVGLMAYRDRLWVFADHFVDLSEHPNYGLSVLTHGTPDAPATLTDIHFAEPFLGYPYIAAEWSDGAIFHYWLQGEGADEGTWKPLTVYQTSDTVLPAVPNGYAYRPYRAGEPGTLWAPEVERKVGDVVEPTTFNGYEYVVVEAVGSPPRSGDVEPNWIARDGAAVIEEADVALPQPPNQGQPPPVTPPRYNNPGGSRPGDGDIPQVIR